ncbi:MAG: hypothetical protein IT561_28070 [Alphaproteobacteria bacterium]|nr:hypothetical protein [Alphaproteobacteria bacterium]
MNGMRALLGTAMLATLLAAPLTFVAGDASAQAQCRQKCTDEEQACLKRTGNKGQCGGKAGQCLAKCK